MKFYKDNLLTSDWHVLHHNIYWQLPEERKILTGGLFFRPSGKEEFFAAENAIYAKLFDEMKMIIEQNPIKRFIHLGDFCFLNKRNERSPYEEIEQHIPVIPEMFDYLKSKNIQTMMILGNHDEPEKKVGRDVLQYFDHLETYLWEENDLYTHYPIGYSLAKEQVFGTPEQRFYGMPKVFSRLDKKLLSDWNGKELLNFHGHIHQSSFHYPLNKITYRNMCIDFIEE